MMLFSSLISSYMGQRIGALSGPPHAPMARQFLEEGYILVHYFEWIPRIEGLRTRRDL